MPCPNCKSPLPGDGSCCDECGWVLPVESTKRIEHQRRAVSHFLKLAKHGGYGAASGGAQRAHRLAKAVLDDVPGLDDLALEGFREFCLLVKSAPETAQKIAGFE